MTSRGTPLVAELEYRAWAIFDTTDDDDDNDSSATTTTTAATAAPPREAETKSATLLAHELKQGTKKSHRAAENVGFVRNFVKGRVDRKLYKHMLLSLWHTYTALEEELRRNSDNEVYRELHFPGALERKESLEEDIEFFFGPKWREDPGACVLTTTLCARLSERRPTW